MAPDEPTQQDALEPVEGGEAPLYSNIEAFVGNATPEEIDQLFVALTERLSGLKGARSTQGQKVLVAIERTRELLKHLLQVRDNMGESSSDGAGSGEGSP
ncbi:MAG: hypothetical protein ACKVPX_17820 [Myxococcaceae bacterium]